MKVKRFYILMTSFLVIALAIALPSSVARYSSTNTYYINLSKLAVETKDPQFETGTYSGNSEKTFTAQEDGYYAIIAKGGSGGRGIKGSGSSWTTREGGHGDGGAVFAIVNLNKNAKLYYSIGSKGGDASNGSGGSEGTAYYKRGLGGKGCTYESGVTNVVQNKHVASGGGGASTVICNGSASDSKIIVIAAGGGGGGGVDTSLDSGANAGTGGAGGFNFVTSGTYQLNNSSSGNVNKPVDGTVYYGLDGTMDVYSAKYFTYGRGGNTNGGVKGAESYNGAYGGTDAADGKGYSSGNNLTNSSTSSGKGGQAGGVGGAGGGGYAGGGGASGGYAKRLGLSGNNYNAVAGGGGGGSSFVANSVSPSSYSLANSTTIVGAMMSKAGSGFAFSGYSDGWVIFAYLGTSTQKTEYAGGTYRPVAQ